MVSRKKKSLDTCVFSWRYHNGQRQPYTFAVFSATIGLLFLSPQTFCDIFWYGGFLLNLNPMGWFEGTIVITIVKYHHISSRTSHRTQLISPASLQAIEERFAILALRWQHWSRSHLDMPRTATMLCRCSKGFHNEETSATTTPQPLHNHVQSLQSAHAFDHRFLHLNLGDHWPELSCKHVQPLGSHVNHVIRIIKKIIYVEPLLSMLVDMNHYKKNDRHLHCQNLAAASWGGHP